MKTNKVEENKYNNSMLADRLEDLRRNYKKNYSLKSLSDDIAFKTGVYISDKTLSNYENSDLEIRPNVEYLIAIANFYNVSLYYLLGFHDCKNVSNEVISQKTGLLEEAIKGLEDLKQLLDNPVDEWDNSRIDVRYVDIISHFISNENLWITLINEASRLIGLYSNERELVRF